MDNELQNIVILFFFKEHVSPIDSVHIVVDYIVDHVVSSVLYFQKRLPVLEVRPLLRIGTKVYPSDGKVQLGRRNHRLIDRQQFENLQHLVVEQNPIHLLDLLQVHLLQRRNQVRLNHRYVLGVIR